MEKKIKHHKTLGVLCTLLLLLFSFITAQATTVTVSSFQIPNYSGGGATAKVRLYSSDSWTDSDGVPHPAGVVGGTTGFYQEIPCAVAGTTITIPSFTTQSTVDSIDKPTVKITAVLFDYRGAKRDVLFSDWMIPATPTTTWATLVAYNAAKPRHPGDKYPTTAQVSALISAAVGTLNDASDSVKGRTKLSARLALSSGPKAIGDNDERANKQLSIINVKNAPYSATGLGVVSDSTALNSATAACPASTSCVVYYPEGTYLANTLLTNNAKSNVTFRGAGPGATTFKTATPGLTIFQAGTASSFVSRVTWEDMTIDSTGASAVTIDGNFIRGPVTFRRVEFIGGHGVALINGASNVTFEDCVFHSLGNPRLAAISVHGGSKNISFRRTKVKYFQTGITLTSATSTSPIEGVTLEDCELDGGFYYLPAQFTGSGGTVTYTSTTLADSRANFSGLDANTEVRALIPKATGTATSVTAMSMTDSGAGFIMAGVAAGMLVRMGAAFGVISNVTATRIDIEEWLSQTNLRSVQNPSGAYTIYDVRRGIVISSTSTRLTVNGWFGIATGATSTPAGGTLYELQRYVPLYQNFSSASTAKNVQILGGKFKRSAGDQIAASGSFITVKKAYVFKGGDMGIILDNNASNSIVEGCTVIESGTNGIHSFGGDDNQIIGNTVIDSYMMNASTATNAGILIYDGSRNKAVANRVSRSVSANMAAAILVYGPTLNSANGNLVSNNTAWNMPTAAPYITRGGVENGAVANVFVNNGPGSIYQVSQDTGSASTFIQYVDGSGVGVIGNGRQRMNGGAQIGSSGVAITNLLSNTATLDYDLTAAASQDLTITVTGAAVGDAVYLGLPNSSVRADTNFFAWVSAPNTVTVRATRVAGTPNPASGVFKVDVVKR